MSDRRDSGDMEVRYFLGAEMIAVRRAAVAPLSNDVVTLDGREYCVAHRAVRLSDATEEFEAFEVQVQAR